MIPFGIAPLHALILQGNTMQNPGALVTVKAAIKPPGFQVFLFNRGSNNRKQALT